MSHEELVRSLFSHLEEHDPVPANPLSDPYPLFLQPPEGV